jgi:hypothetical protein
VQSARCNLTTPPNKKVSGKINQKNGGRFNFSYKVFYSLGNRISKEAEDDATAFPTFNFLGEKSLKDRSIIIIVRLPTACGFDCLSSRIT